MIHPISQIINIIKQTFPLIHAGYQKVATKKDRFDLVTNVDKAIQQYLSEALQKLYPSAKIVGEEVPLPALAETDEMWIIDPIDGTANFVKQHHDFGILLAYYKDGIGELAFMVENGESIYYAVKGQGIFKNGSALTLAKRVPLMEGLICCNHASFNRFPTLMAHSFGQRYYGSALSDGLAVILGRTEAYIASHLELWDAAPLYIFGHECGLVCLTETGQKRSWFSRGSLVYTHQSNQQEIMECLQHDC